MFNSKQDKMLFLLHKQSDEYTQRRIALIEEGLKYTIATLEAKFAADLAAQKNLLSQQFNAALASLEQALNNIQRGGGVSIKSPEQEEEFYDENVRRSEEMLRQFKQQGKGGLARDIE